MKNILPLLADIANGIFATLFAGWATGTEVIWWHFLVGIPLAMLPDLDALPELFARGKLGAFSEHTTDHREALHYPVAFLVVGATGILVNPFFGWMFLTATMLHFLNDLYGTGWGVPVLWPFSHRRYKLLERRANQTKRILVETGKWDTLPEGERALHLIVSWSHAELPEYIRRFGLEDWIDKYYLRMSWTSGIEYALFLGALILAGTTLLY